MNVIGGLLAYRGAVDVEEWLAMLRDVRWVVVEVRKAVVTDGYVVIRFALIVRLTAFPLRFQAGIPSRRGWRVCAACPQACSPLAGAWPPFVVGIDRKIEFSHSFPLLAIQCFLVILLCYYLSVDILYAILVLCMLLRLLFNIYVLF